MAKATMPLILAAALTTFGCKIPLPGRDSIVDKLPKTPIVLRDAEGEIRAYRKPSEVVPVPLKKEGVKGKIEETPQGTVITTEWGMKILKKSDGTVIILERPEKKPMPTFIH
ncbi:MAG: hypothetical protein AABW86_05500 [Candidatus Micrarchaeota archaeon]